MVDVALIASGAPLPEEQETTVCIDYQSKRANVYSSKPSTIGLLQGWIRDHPDDVVCLHADASGLEVSVPMEWVKLRAPKRRTEEWKAEARKRLAEARTRKEQPRSD